MDEPFTPFCFSYVYGGSSPSLSSIVRLITLITNMKKKTSEILKALEQMHRDKRPTDEIYAATMRYREFAEAEEEAESKKPKPPIQVSVKTGMENFPNIV